MYLARAVKSEAIDLIIDRFKHIFAYGSKLITAYMILIKNYRNPSQYQFSLVRMSIWWVDLHTAALCIIDIENAIIAVMIHTMAFVQSFIFECNKAGERLTLDGLLNRHDPPPLYRKL